MVTCSRRLHLALLGCVLVLGACASDPGGVQPDPVAVRFHPTPGTLVAPALDQLEFYAETAAGAPLDAAFFINDALVLEGPRLQWEAAVLGETRVEAVVDLDGIEHRARWVIRVTDDGELPSPQVVSVTALPGDVPGSVKVEWDAPGGTSFSIDPVDFHVSWSPDPITEEGVDALPFVVEPWNRGVITHTALVEGLVEQTDYHVAVRTRDVLGRLSVLSPEREARATGHFDLCGTVRLLVPDVPEQPLGGVVMDWNGIKTVTEPDGSFELPNLADTLLKPLEAREGSGLDYYMVITDPLEPVHQNIDLVLFPRDFVSLVIDDVPVQMTRKEFTVLMTNNSLMGSDMKVRSWEQYPVPVYAEPFVNQGTETVDYHQAFTWGVDVWNQAAGTDLFVMVDAPPSTGVVCSPRPREEMGINIGFTSLVRPAGSLFQEIPEAVLITVRNNFNSQTIANRIASHELGHALLLPHSPDQRHLMHAIAPPSSGGIPNRDVVFVVRLGVAMSRDTSLAWYVDPQ